jgi:hypothetical protein
MFRSSGTRNATRASHGRNKKAEALGLRLSQRASVVTPTGLEPAASESPNVAERAKQGSKDTAATRSKTLKNGSGRTSGRGSGRPDSSPVDAVLAALAGLGDGELAAVRAALGRAT